MSWLWRTPKGLDEITTRQLVLLTLAAFITAPVIGFVWFKLNELLIPKYDSRPWIEGPAFLLTYSFVLSWAGYPVSVALAYPLIRRGYGGLLPMAGAGAVVGIVLFVLFFSRDPSSAFLVGVTGGGLCMAIWWACAALVSRRFASR